MAYRLLSPFVLALCAILFSGCEPTLLAMASGWQSLSCCGIIVLILDVIAIVEVVGSSRDSGSKIIWILFIVFAPFLGFICYYIFANRS